MVANIVQVLCPKCDAELDWYAYDESDRTVKIECPYCRYSARPKLDTRWRELLRRHGRFRGSPTVTWPDNK